MVVFAALLLSSAGPQAPNTCTAYLGQEIEPIPIAKVIGGLPPIAAKNQFESTADYNRRLSAADASAALSTVIIERPWGTKVPPYDADAQKLTIYPHNLGVGGTDFGAVSALGIGDGDPFGGIGFEITRSEVQRSTFEAVNGFGARFTATRIEEAIDAVWERQLKLGESPFVGSKFARPLAEIVMDPSKARDILQKGGTAIVARPVAPFGLTGQTVVRATTMRPAEVVKSIHVLTADVQCVLIHDSSRTVVLAFDVK